MLSGLSLRSGMAGGRDGDKGAVAWRSYADSGFDKTVGNQAADVGLRLEFRIQPAQTAVKPPKPVLFERVDVWRNKHARFCVLSRGRKVNRDRAKLALDSANEGPRRGNNLFGLPALH